MSHCLMWISDWRHKWTILFKNWAGQAMTVAGARCRVMITLFFCDVDVAANMWFQQDGIACHTALHTIITAWEIFIFSRYSDQNRLPRSCVLIPLDIFSWSHLISQVYCIRLTSTRSLKEEYQRYINIKFSHIYEESWKSWKNFVKRAPKYMESPWSYFLHMLFQYTHHMNFIIQENNYKWKTENCLLY